MPKCAGSLLRPLSRGTPRHHSPALRATAYDRPGTFCERRAKLSSIASPPSKQHEDLRANTLTVLHKTTALLPRVLPPELAREQEGLALWQDVLGKVYEDLTRPQAAREKDPVRIVVYGADESNGANELVSALLRDPFLPEAQKTALQTRWDARPPGSRRLVIRHGSPPASDNNPADDVLYLHSSWLQQFNVPVELIELRGTPSDPEHARTLLNADVSVAVSNPASQTHQTPPSTSTRPSSQPFNSHTIVAVYSPSPTSVSKDAARAGSEKGTRVVSVDPGRATHGLDIIAQDSSSTLSVQRYQDELAGSNLSALTRAVSELLSAAPTKAGAPGSRVLAIHTQTGRTLIKDVLAICRTVLFRANREADAVLDSASDLREKVEEAKAKVLLDVFQADEVDKALASARKDIQVVLNALPGYRLLFSVDDVRENVSGAARRALERGLEHNLVFHAGRLAVLQTSFADASAALLNSLPPRAPYSSPVLHNALAQLSSAPSYAVTRTALTPPLHKRQRQLDFATMRLHRRAQQAVVGMGGSVVAGAGYVWLGWIGQLALPLESAAGVGTFGAAVGIWWMVNRWERAKKRWWKDWDRVSAGLERDLRGTVVQVMEKQVTVVAEAACTGLEGAVKKRKAEIASLEDEVSVLENDLQKGSS